MLAMRKKIKVTGGELKFKLPSELWDCEVEVLVFSVFEKEIQQKTDVKPRFMAECADSWKGRMEIADDFDEPLEDFKEYMS